MTTIRLLFRVGIKVMDEWQISLGYVRGSNIYVRGYLDLCAWSLRLRTYTEENHYIMMLFPPLDKRNPRDKAKGLCISSGRYIGELGVRYLSSLNRGQNSR